MGDLFADAARERMPDTAPLAQRARPATLEEFVGQRHVLGERSALEDGHLHRQGPIGGELLEDRHPLGLVLEVDDRARPEARRFLGQ